MYSGFLPKGLSEADLSPDEEEENTQEKNIQEQNIQEENTQEEKLNTPTDKCPAERERTVQTDSSSSSAPESCLPGVAEDLWQVCAELFKSHININSILKPHS